MEPPALGDRELLAKLIEVSRETAGLMLSECGAVPPFGLTISADGIDVRGMFPQDDNPDATPAELLALVEQHLLRSAASGKISGVAVVRQIASGERAAIGTQVQTASGGRAVRYPFRKSTSGWELDVAEDAPDLLVTARFF